MPHYFFSNGSELKLEKEKTFDAENPHHRWGDIFFNIFDSCSNRIHIPRRNFHEIEKEIPQPQDDLALGFLILKDSPINSDSKSISDPFSILTESESITIFLYI